MTSPTSPGVSKICSELRSLSCQVCCDKDSDDICQRQCDSNIIFIHAFTTHASSVTMLNQKRWQSLGEQRGKDVDGLFEKVSFQTAFERVESG